MGEEAKTQQVQQTQGPQQIEVKAESDPTLFRTASILQTQVRDIDILKNVVEEAKKFSIGGQEVDKKLYDFVEQYQESKRTPYSVEFYQAKEISDVMVEDFKKIDNYILDRLREAKQNTTLEAYNALLMKIEKALGLTPNSETMHRITEIIKFIDARRSA